MSNCKELLSYRERHDKSKIKVNKQVQSKMAEGTSESINDVKADVFHEIETR